MSIFSTQVLAENEYYQSGSVQQKFYLYFELKAHKFEPSKERIPLNVSMVVDRSGSMGGEKIEFVKKAMSFVVDNLSSEDILSIVQYDDKIDVVSPSATVNEKISLYKKIQAIRARGMTNLSGGMLEGYNQVESTKGDKYVNRCLLLSDGLANKGITDPEKLKQIAQKKFREKGIGLSTFGVGADFNELLMTHLSEFGGGNYYFIDSPDKIPAIFAEELKGLLSVVAQNTKLQIKFPSAYFKCSHIYGGFPFEVQGDQLSINFNDVVSEERKAALIQFDMIQPLDSNVSFEASLNYEDVIETLESVTETYEVPLSLTKDEALFKSGVKVHVIEQIIYYQASQQYEEIMLKADKHDFEGAKKMGQQALEKIETHFKSHGESEDLKKLYQSIKIYLSQLSKMEKMSRHDYQIAQKSSRMTSYMSRKKKF